MSLATVTILGSVESLLLEGGVDVDINLTFVGQVVLLGVLLLILKPVLFEPMLKLFEEREKRIDGAKKKARDTDVKSAKAESEFQTQLGKAQAQGNVERERLRGEGVKAENEVLAKVRTETAAFLDERRQKAQAELKTARAELQGSSQDLARQLAARVLGREVS
jgi:F-type H+-transporting ATPase subunit b